MRDTLLELAAEEEAKAEAHEAAECEDVRREAQRARRIAIAAKEIAEGLWY